MRLYSYYVLTIINKTTVLGEILQTKNSVL